MKTIIRLFVLIIVLNVFVAGCRKDSVELPATIKELMKPTNCGCEPYIDQYTWKNETIYIQSCKGPTCFCGVAYFNAKGEQIAMPQGYTLTSFIQDAKFERHVWSCKQ